jgi:hypothetical protein
MDSATHTASRVPTGSGKRSGRTRAVVAAAGLSALMAAASLVAAVPAAATQGTLPPSLKKFIHCPVSNPAVTACLLASTTGTFKINSTTINLTKPATLSLGLIANPDGSVTAVLPTDGSPGLIAPPTALPGLPGLLGVTAQPQLVGVLPTVSLSNLFTRSGAAVVLPIDVLLGGNVLLGSNCTVGDPSNQIVLNLTTGTTNPPPPNQPITGAVGTVHGARNGVITIKGQTLVDNAFAVPGASNCGLFGVLDPVMDAAQGLPSAAGSNTAILSGNTFTAPAALIRHYIP